MSQIRQISSQERKVTGTERLYIHVNATAPPSAPLNRKGYTHNSRTGELCVFFSIHLQENPYSK